MKLVIFAAPGRLTQGSCHYMSVIAIINVAYDAKDAWSLWRAPLQPAAVTGH